MKAFTEQIVFGTAIGLWHTLAFWLMWGWFAVPLGAPAISFPHAFGLYGIAVTILLWGYTPTDASAEKIKDQLLAKAFIGAFVLSQGYIVHLCLVRGFLA